MIGRATALAVFSLLAMGVTTARADWVPCAREGGVCRVPYPTEVRYGARGYYTSTFTERGIRCNNDNFGDPISGVAKACFYQARGRGDWDRRDEWDRPPPPRHRPRPWEY